MNNKLAAVVRFENMWLFLPVLLLGLYGVQSIAGILYFKSPQAYEFARILGLGCLSYALAFWALRKFVPIPNRPLQIVALQRIPSGWWVLGISAAYFLLIIYAVASSEKVALWEAINGAPPDQIAFAREALFKTRVGWERSLLYLNAMFSSALMPYVLAISYLEKKSYRHVLLGLFVISLLPSLEKALVIKAFLPLIIVVFNGYLPRRAGYTFIALTLGIIIGTTALTKIGRIDVKSEVLQTQQDRARFEIVDAGNPLGYIVNRTLWIPYVTGHDWLGYFSEKLHGKFLLGSTSTLVCAITGQQRIKMDNEVFMYQYGREDLQTGSANAVFLVDAFVNFGWLGVVAFAALFAGITRLVELTSNPAASACFYYFAYQVSVGGMFGVLFSNGLLLLLIMALTIRPGVASKEMLLIRGSHAASKSA